jgi:hypothetical protein
MQFEKETNENSIIKYSSIRYKLMGVSKALIKLNISYRYIKEQFSKLSNIKNIRQIAED